MSLLTHLIFDVAFAALATLNALLVLTVLSSSIKLWPTPSAKSWQHYTFWPLFRGGLGLTLLYAILTAHWPLEDEALPLRDRDDLRGRRLRLHHIRLFRPRHRKHLRRGRGPRDKRPLPVQPQSAICGLHPGLFRRRAGERRDPHGDSCAGSRSSFTSSCLTRRSRGFSELMAMSIAPTRRGRRAFFEPQAPRLSGGRRA